MLKLRNTTTPVAAASMAYEPDAVTVAVSVTVPAVRRASSMVMV